jgi:hypothetical protein
MGRPCGRCSRDLRQEAVEVLRAAILSGELAPGSIHSAVSLAELMGVSPTRTTRAGHGPPTPNRSSASSSGTPTLDPNQRPRKPAGHVPVAVTGL